MKRLTIIVIFIFSICQIKGQSNYIDSLKRELAIAKEDSNKVKLYNNLGYQYFFNQPDTAIFYGQKALDLAQKIRFKKGEASAYFTLWVPYFTKGEYARALDYGYKELHISEDLRDEKKIAGAQMGLTNIYREQGDLKRALAHLKISKGIYEKLGLAYGNYAINIHGNLAMIYDESNELDSALIHAQIALDTAIKNSRADNYITVISTVIGNVHRKRGNYAIALQYYQSALPVFTNNKVIKEYNLKY